jgi:hypothetical protein
LKIQQFNKNSLFSRGGSHAAGRRAWEPGLLKLNLRAYKLSVKEDKT